MLLCTFRNSNPLLSSVAQEEGSPHQGCSDSVSISKKAILAILVYVRIQGLDPLSELNKLLFPFTYLKSPQKSRGLWWQKLLSSPKVVMECVVEPSFNPGTRFSDSWISVSSRSVWPTEQILGQLRLHRKTGWEVGNNLSARADGRANSCILINYFR